MNKTIAKQQQYNIKIKQLQEWENDDITISKLPLPRVEHTLPGYHIKLIPGHNDSTYFYQGQNIAAHCSTL